MTLLAAESEDDLALLYQTARETRTAEFGDRIFLYGFVYFSTFCRNNCNFCYFRKENKIGRYRKNNAEILAICEKLAESGVHLIDLTMGEDPFYHQENFETILELIAEIKKRTGLPVMISPGVVPRGIIDRFAEAGVEWYALYQETHNPALFRKLRIEQEYEERMAAKQYAKEKGMLIEEGIMTGIGENLSDLADSLLEMGRIGAKQVRVMSFVPQAGIPMELCETPERSLEMKVIAAMRLLYPRALIPASLDIDGIDGLYERILAGANLITSLIPPMAGLSGVAQSEMDIDNGSRSVSGVVAPLASMGLRPATAAEYRQFLSEQPENRNE